MIGDCSFTWLPNGSISSYDLLIIVEGEKGQRVFGRQRTKEVQLLCVCVGQLGIPIELSILTNLSFRSVSLFGSFGSANGRSVGRSP